MGLFAGIKNIAHAVRIHPLAGKHRFHTYKRILSWQISQMLFPGIKKMPFAAGTFLMVKKGMTGATGNIYFGLHEFEDMAFLLHFLREEDCFADIGANIGSYTILASGVCRARSVSFEPVPVTFRHLQENVRINKIEHLVSLYDAAAGSKEGILKLTAGMDTVNHVLSANESSDNYIEAPVLPLDSLRGKADFIRLIKIDAEGFESEVLKGMNGLLKEKELKAIIIELNGSGERYGYHDSDIHQLLTDEGFRPYGYDPFSRKLKELSRFNSTNTIYLRDIDFIKNRISNAKKIALLSECF